MGGNYHCLRTNWASPSTSHDDVRPRRRARRLGAPHPPVARHPKKRTGGFTEFVHAGIHSREHAALPSWWSKAGSQTGRAPACCTLWRACSCMEAIKNLQVSWVKLGIRNVARLPASGAQTIISGTLMEENISKAAGAQTIWRVCVAGRNFASRFDRLGESQRNGPPPTESGASLTNRKMTRRQHEPNSGWSARRTT